MLVKEIMSKNVITVNVNDTILNAAKKYRDHKIGCLVVTKNHHCIGIITERDLIERALCTHLDVTQAKTKDIMSENIITTHPLENIENVLLTMKKHKIKKLPVISNDHITGIITITDIAHARPELTQRFMESWIKPRWD
jgi:CBS domain-containing protein